MLQHTYPEFQLDFHRQRADEWHRVAVADHLAHEATAGRPHVSWWRWPTRRPRPVRAPAAS
jgi:hypothetical protein